MMAEWARVALDASIIYVKIVVIKRDELRNGGVYEFVSKTVMKRCLSLSPAMDVSYTSSWHKA